ncbi:MAG: PAS domain S-box protein [Sulfuricella sp.]|nr:PAS domain S-box protein [Sulfuricella sp.]
MRINRFLRNLTPIRLWGVSIIVSVLMAELLVSGMGLLLKGEITWDYLLTGFVTSLFVGAAVVAGVTWFLLEQKAVEEALIDSERRFRDLADAAGEMIWEVDAQCRYTYVSDKSMAVMGYPPQEMVGRTIADFLPAEDAHKVSDKLALALRSKLAFRDYEHRCRHKDGRIIWKSASGLPITNSAGEVIGYRGTSLDISRRKEVETSLQSLVESLEQRVRDEVARSMASERLLIQQSRLAAMGEMIGNIAHQWRQPLNALMLLLSNIKDAHQFNELDAKTMDESLTTGRRLIKGMSATIDDFRDFFRPTKEKSVFSLNTAVMSTLDLLSAGLRYSRIEVFLDGAEERLAIGYPNEFSQVLLNLLGNAKDALLARNIENAEIRIALTARAGMVGVVVRDNAGGIPHDILPKIFDPYFTTKEKGTGIGLYMSKTIIEDHMSGCLTVCNLSDGAEFTVLCPAP